MTDQPKKSPADLREEAGDNDELFKQMMHDHGYMVHPRHPDRAVRRELGIRRGLKLPSDLP